MTTNTPLPPSSASKRAQRTYTGRRFLDALTRGPYRKFSGSHSPSSLKSKGLAFPVLALLAALAVGLLVLLPGGPVQAQEQESVTIKYDENGEGPVATFAATDPEGGMVFWSLGGEAAAAFNISGGVLTFKSPPDYETPAATNNEYMVTVQASDGGGDDPTTFEVMVTVENVEEAGMATLSSLQPQAGIPLTANLSDPDGATTDPDDSGDPVPWQWSRSDTQDGEFTDISGAEAMGTGVQATYRPKDGDIGKYLRVTFTYADPEDPDTEKEANGVSANAVWPARSDEQPPVFPGVTLARSVAENSAPGTPVGVPVAATDPTTNDVLTYTMSDDDNEDDFFDIDADTGQIRVGAKTRLDREDEDGFVYTVTVTATDTSGKDNVITAQEVADDVNLEEVAPPTVVTITITDVDEAPSVEGAVAGNGFDTPTTSFSVEEDAAELASGNTDTYTGDDPEGQTTTLSLSGPDASDFSISSDGVLAFKDDPDYEDPQGGARGNSNLYEVTIEASDGDNAGTLNVTVKVTNKAEDGEVTLSDPKPEIGMPLTATLEEDDGGVIGVSWQWASVDAVNGDCPAANAGEWAVIAGAKSAMYTPTDEDPDVTGQCLRATATYVDAFDLNPGTKPMAMEVSANPVGTDSTNRAPAFGESSYQRYVAEGESETAVDVGDPVAAKDANDDVLTYTLSGADAGPFMITQDGVAADNDGASDNTGGQIQVKANEELDREEKASYTFTVTATDPSGLSSSTSVTINVTDVNEAPKLTGDKEKDFAENANVTVETYRATDPEMGRVYWSLGGADAGDFNISSGGVLTFKSPPDFEAPTDDEMDNVYIVMVRASDEETLTTDLEITITVTDEEEPGRVTFSSLQPQDGTVLTATLMDPDVIETPSNVEWQWASSTSSRSGFNDIPGAGAMGMGLTATYEPTTGDVNRYLEVTFTYIDGIPDDTEEDTERAVSTSSVRVTRTGNRPPAFLSAALARSVAENSAPATPVGVPATATDPDEDDVLTYTMSADDGDDAFFDIDSDTGQIRVGAKTRLNREPVASAVYMVTVTAKDTSGVTNDVPTVVTITITDVDEAPSVKGTVDDTDPTTRFSVMEDETELDSVNTTDNYTGVDPEGDATTLSLSGPDASDFSISSTGVLSFKEDPDYEDPKGGARGNSNLYEVTIEASDSDNAGTLNVTVKVTNKAEDGEVTLSDPKPEIGMPLTATLEDDDGGVIGVSWQWASVDAVNGDCPAAAAPAANGWEIITSAKSAMYTPTDEDPNVSGQCLQATAIYVDAFDLNPETKPTARGVSANPVGTDSTNRAPTFGERSYQRYVAEDTYELLQDVGDPVAAKDANDDVLTYTLSGADAGPFIITQDGVAADNDGASDNLGGQIRVDGAEDAAEKLNREMKATYTFTVTAMDPSGLSSSTTVTIHVTDVDEAPVIMEGGLMISGRSSISLAEGSGTEVATYTADGPESASARWSLSGDDAGDFNIPGGVLTFKVAPDYENPADADRNNVYMVTVKASDGTNMPERNVTVRVTNLDELGTVSGDDTARYAENGTGAVATYTADGSVAATWSVSGADMDDFTIGATDGMLMFAASPNYEAATDADTDNIYQVTVQGNAGGEMGEVAVTVTVTDVDEVGAVTLSEMYPVVGVELTATLTDPDGMTSDETWQWASADAMGGTYAAIARATMASYTPREAVVDDPATTDVDETSAGDVGMYLRATVSYTDDQGTGQTAMMESANAVAAEATGLAISGRSSVERAEGSGTEVATYTAAGPTAGSVTWTLSGADMDDFNISSSGVLTFRASPDYETPTDAGTNNVYQVTVVATDSNDSTNMDTHEVMVMVTNEEETGEVTLWAGGDALTMAPQVGDTITGAVMDPDVPVNVTAWQWARTTTPDVMASWMDIDGATDAAYMVMEGDTGHHLRVMATYTDAVGTDMAMEYSMPTMMVGAEAEDTLLDRYDENDNGQIDRPEVLDAIRDFVFNQTIERDDVVDVIRLFIFSRSR